VVVASSTSGIRESEAAIRHLHQRGTLTAGYSYLQQEIGSVSEALTLELGITGPAYTVSTACSASAKVFQSGRLLLERGLCDAVLVGGVDSLCRLTLNGFGALELISPARTNPFSKNRQGITIGEGACFFLLTKEGGGVQLLGVGESSDAYHMSSPDPEGTGAVAAMNRALTAAKRTPEQITVVNLHGTGTLHNDAMEAKAVSTVFPEQPWMSGTKPLTGHLLGASGATEVGLCWLLLDEYLRTGVLPLPEHPFDGEFDSLLPPLRLTPRGGINLTPTSPTCMSTSFGFGGTNCVVVIGV
jgi:3-oxoacyl-[acyl-carrier-protein] synthase-1